MRFEKSGMILVNMRSFTSKQGNELTFLKVAEKSTYDSVEIMPSSDYDLTVVPIGGSCRLVLEYEGRYMNGTLIPEVEEASPETPKGRR